jgi:GGDEF domain-containing protein
VLLPETSKEESKDIAEKLHRHLDAAILANGSSDHVVRVSFAEFPIDGGSPTDLVRHMDAMMLRLRTGLE